MQDDYSTLNQDLYNLPINASAPPPTKDDTATGIEWKAMQDVHDYFVVRVGMVMRSLLLHSRSCRVV